MKKTIYELLTEGENLQNTESALAIEAMVDQLDAMVVKLSSMLTKDLANLVRKTKYDNNIEEADALQKNIGGKIQEAMQTIMQLKSDLETESVNMMNGTVSAMDTEENDFSKEFNPKEEDEDEESVEDEESTEEVDNMDDFEEMERELKK